MKVRDMSGDRCSYCGTPHETDYDIPRAHTLVACREYVKSALDATNRELAEATKRAERAERERDDAASAHQRAQEWLDKFQSKVAESTLRAEAAERRCAELRTALHRYVEVYGGADHHRDDCPADADGRCIYHDADDLAERALRAPSGGERGEQTSEAGTSTCERCGGSGRVADYGIKGPCPSCGGKGRR